MRFVSWMCCSVYILLCTVVLYSNGYEYEYNGNNHGGVYRNGQKMVRHIDGWYSSDVLPNNTNRSLTSILLPQQTMNMTGMKLDVYIQLDYSGSVREANPVCRKQTGKICWELVTDFVQEMLTRLTQSIPWGDLRVHLSYFTCQPQKQIPTNKVLTSPFLTDRETKMNAALDRMRGMNQKRMYGTCPSRGARAIYHKARLTYKRPAMYLIVTDGRVQSSDRARYRKVMSKMGALLRDRVNATIGELQDMMCAVTVGDVANGKDIEKLIGSSCVYSVQDFAEMGRVQEDLVPNMLRIAGERYQASLVTDEYEYEYEPVRYAFAEQPGEVETNSPSPETLNDDTPLEESGSSYAQLRKWLIPFSIVVMGLGVLCLIVGGILYCIRPQNAHVREDSIIVQNEDG